MDEFQYSERGVIRKGDIFRARGGSTYGDSRIGPRGLFKALGFVTKKTRKETRVWIEAMIMREVKNTGVVLPAGGVTLLYVSGSPYSYKWMPDGWVCRPSRVSRLRAQE